MFSRLEWMKRTACAAHVQRKDLVKRGSVLLSNLRRVAQFMFFNVRCQSKFTLIHLTEAFLSSWQRWTRVSYGSHIHSSLALNPAVDQLHAHQDKTLSDRQTQMYRVRITNYDSKPFKSLHSYYNAMQWESHLSNTTKRASSTKFNRHKHLFLGSCFSQWSCSSYWRIRETICIDQRQTFHCSYSRSICRPQLARKEVQSKTYSVTSSPYTTSTSTSTTSIPTTSATTRVRMIDPLQFYDIDTGSVH